MRRNRAPVNVWVIGDDSKCVVIDPARDLAAVLPVIGDRMVVAVLCTHAHADHLRSASELGRLIGAPVLLHPADLQLWRLTHPTPPDGFPTDSERILVADVALDAIHTPGHTPGSLSFCRPELGTVFSGDPLQAGGPGVTDGPFNNHDEIVDRIAELLMTLPLDTRGKPGHGGDTTLGAERAVIECLRYVGTT